MYLDNVREKIDLHEEIILQTAHDNPSYPALTWLFDEFYNGPIISPEKSNALVHELIELKQNFVSKEFSHTFERLILFFSKAYKMSAEIKCSSD